jgi:hypothetical protein
MLHDGQATLIRPRRTIADLWSDELVPTFTPPPSFTSPG